MRIILLGVLVVGAVLIGCIGPVCMADCANVTTLTVTDAAGNPLNDVSGIVQIGEERYTVACGSAQAPDAGSAADGGTLDLVGPGNCSGNKVTFSHGPFADVRAELRAGNKAFNGVVAVTDVRPDPAPMGACSCSANGKEGTVILQ